MAAADGGRTLLYTDADAGLVGFVDITDPAAPTAAGTLVTGGSPTSVAIAGSRALVAVDDTVTEGDGTFGPHAGRLLVVDLATRAVVRTINTGGQPDSVKVGPTGKFAVVAIENQRDEDGGGRRSCPTSPPTAPSAANPGSSPSSTWREPRQHGRRATSASPGLAGMKFNTDPEPEFVDINANELAVVSLQENNHLVVIELRSGLVIRHWSAGSVANQVADTSESPLDIVFNGSISVPREPDAVAWIQNGGRILTADEGDYEGGSRSFTLFDLNTLVAGASGPGLELQTVRHGHYVESRSANKGIEPEGVAVGSFGGQELFFVGSERANSVGVYRLVGNTFAFQQLLPTGVSPEGLLPIGTREPVRHRQRGRGHPVDLPVRSRARRSTRRSSRSTRPPRVPSPARPLRSPGVPCRPWPPTAPLPAASSPSTTAPTPTPASTPSTPRPAPPASSTSPTSRASPPRAGTSRGSPPGRPRPAPASGWPARATPTPTPLPQSDSTTSCRWQPTEPS